MRHVVIAAGLVSLTACLQPSAEKPRLTVRELPTTPTQPQTPGQPRAPVQPQVQQPATPVCMPTRNGDPQRNLVATVIDREVRLLQADGSWRTPFTFGRATGTAVDEIGVSDVVHAGPWLAAVAGLFTQNDWQRTRHEVVLVDTRTATVVWSAVLPENSRPQLFLDESGHLAIAGSTKPGRLVGPDGRMEELAVAPRGAIEGQPRIPAVQGLWGNAPVAGWFELATHRFTPTRWPISRNDLGGGLEMPWLAGRWLYRSTASDGSTLLVSEGADGTVATLPIAPNSSLVGADLRGRALLQDAENDGRHWTLADPIHARLQTLPMPGESEPAIELYRWLTASPSLERDGTLTTSIRLGGDTQAMRSTDDGATWLPLGLPTPLPTAEFYGRWTHVERHGPTTLITVQDSRGYWQQWTGAQLLRDGDTHASLLTLDAATFGPAALAPRLSDDGACLLTWTAPLDAFLGQQDAQLSVTDVATGQQATLLEGKAPHSSQPW